MQLTNWEDYNEVWDVERLLRSFVKIKKYENLKLPDALKLEYKRLDSVLCAYGHSFYNPQSKTCATEKLKELESLLEEITHSENYLWLESPFNRENLFKQMLELRCRLGSVRDYWGELERSPMSRVVQGLCKAEIKNSIQKIDRILVLLLGDDYDRSISERELIEKYRYPASSDSHKIQTDFTINDVNLKNFDEEVLFIPGEYSFEWTPTCSFYITKTPVTPQVWEMVMGEKLGCTTVSWDSCMKFIQEISRMTVKSFRIPSYNLWERSKEQYRFLKRYINDSDYVSVEVSDFDTFSRVADYDDDSAAQLLHSMGDGRKVISLFLVFNASDIPF